MKKNDYQAPEMEVVKLKVQGPVMLVYSGDQPKVVDGEDGDIAD